MANFVFFGSSINLVPLPHTPHCSDGKYTSYWKMISFSTALQLFLFKLIFWNFILPRQVAPFQSFALVQFPVSLRDYLFLMRGGADFIIHSPHFGCSVRLHKHRPLPVRHLCTSIQDFLLFSFQHKICLHLSPMFHSQHPTCYPRHFI